VRAVERPAALPGVNTRVGVRVDGCCRHDLMTRVEDATPSGEGGHGGLVVVAPTHPCGLAMPARGTRVHVRWTEQGGVSELPAVVSGTGLRPIAVWELRATGPPVRVQRRRHVRVETPALPVELRAGEQRLPAWLADVSESGLRCTMEPWAAALLQVGGNTVAWLRLGDRDGLDLALPAQVVRIKPDGRQAEVACQFVGIPMGTADQLRKYVFALQLRERRRAAGLGG
jgi:PilZ domain